MLIPGRRSQGLILTCLTGIAGALLGGGAATRIFHLHHALNGFFNLSTWLTAIAGAAILLLAWHLVTGQSGRSRRAGRFRTPMSRLTRPGQQPQPGERRPAMRTGRGIFLITVAVLLSALRAGSPHWLNLHMM